MNGNISVYKENSVKKPPDGIGSDTSDSDSEDSDEDSDSDGESDSQEEEDEPTGLTDTGNEEDSDAETDAEKTGNDDTSDGSNDNTHRETRIVDLRSNSHPRCKARITRTISNIVFICCLQIIQHMSITPISSSLVPKSYMPSSYVCFFPVRTPGLFAPVKE